MIKCIVGEFNKHKDKCFNWSNMFLPLKKTGLFYEGEIKIGTEWVLFIDLPEQAMTNLQTVRFWKELGFKIAYAFYDEARFDTVWQLIQLGLCDKLILFDSQYRNSFNVPIYISDYFVNEDLFNHSDDEIDELCYFGHLQFTRKLPQGCFHLHDYNKTFNQLYYEVSKYKGGLCFSSGRDVLGHVIHHNKAKAIEYLMCGIPSYSEIGIMTQHYNKYLNTFDLTAKPKNPDVEIIKLLNQKVIQDFVNQFV